MHISFKKLTLASLGLLLIAGSISSSAYAESLARPSTTKTGNALTLTVNDLQKTLDKTQKELSTQLSGTMQRLQKLYDGKVKSLVETPLFKGVECLGYLNANTMTREINTIFAEYQKNILEEYVGISADIKRLSVGLTQNAQTIRDEITALQQKFSTELQALEAKYENNYQQLKADFDAYYSVNQTLVYQIAEKIQKIEVIREKYATLLRAHTELQDTLKRRTKVLEIVALPLQSVTAILQGDLDAIIADYRTKNPEIDMKVVEAKKAELMQDFAQQLSGFVGILFGADYRPITYLQTKAKAEAFIATYLQSQKYQCTPLLSAPTSRERTYLQLAEEIDALVPGLEKAERKVASRRTDQLQKIDSALEQVFVLYYNKAMRAEKEALNKYLIKLIADAYYTQKATPSS